MFDFTRTNDFQYQCQFVDSDNIIRGDQRKNVHITDNIIRVDQRKNVHITDHIIRGDQRKNVHITHKSIYIVVNILIPISVFCKLFNLYDLI